MSDIEIKLKEGAELNVEDVARIACALKSLAVYTCWRVKTKTVLMSSGSSLTGGSSQ